MERRSFMGWIGGSMGAAMAGAGPLAGAERTEFYVMENLFLRNGTQLPRVHQFMKDGWVPAVAKASASPVLVLEALVAAHMPQVTVISGFRSLDAVWSAHNRINADREWQKHQRVWEEGAEAPYETYSSTLLRAAPYSPELEIAKTQRKSPRVFEVRVYHSPTWRQLEALHARFAGPEIRIFHRCGIHPVLYSSGMFGAWLPNLTYVIPFDSLADREKAWAAFGADPEWVKVRAESIEKHGQISSTIQISLHRAAAYSPVQ